MAEQIITQDYLHQIFDYKDGELYWKNRKRKSFNGKIAGSIKSAGYKIIKLNKKYYLNHRFIYLYHHGYLPSEIDHKDCNKLNNNIENLRIATHSENQKNRPRQINNKSGYKNVCWNKKNEKWYVHIKVNDKVKYFGAYFDIQVARFIAETMRYKYHKEFANHS